MKLNPKMTPHSNQRPQAALSRPGQRPQGAREPSDGGRPMPAAVAPNSQQRVGPFKDEQDAQMPRNMIGRMGGHRPGQPMNPPVGQPVSPGVDGPVDFWSDGETEDPEAIAATDKGPIPSKTKLDELRVRQREVLLGLATGLSEKEVANELGISHNTVHAHVKELHRHFTVSSRGELLSLFVDRRVLHLLRGHAKTA